MRLWYNVPVERKEKEHAEGSAWYAQRERGAGRLRMAFMWWVYALLGKTALKIACVPTAACIYAFAAPVRRNLRAFYAAVGQRGRIFRHVLDFAWSLADKVDACTLKKSLPRLTVRDDVGGRAFRELVAAGKGAFLNDDPIHVSDRKTLEESLILFGTCPYHRERSAEDFELFRRVFLRSQDVRRLGSAALDLAYIACGRSGLFFERDLKPWDYAAGLILVEEAGGTVTDYCRKRPDLRGNSDIVAGNGITEQLFFRDFGDAL